MTRTAADASLASAPSASLWIARILEEEAEEFVIGCMPETGSNCSSTFIPIPTDEADRQKAALSAISPYVFSSGRQCVHLSRRLDEIMKTLEIPEGIKWDGLLAVACFINYGRYSRWDEKAMLSTWSFLLACPAQALGLRR